jgi:hypothetical protein
MRQTICAVCPKTKSASVVIRYALSACYFTSSQYPFFRLSRTDFTRGCNYKQPDVIFNAARIRYCQQELLFGLVGAQVRRATRHDMWKNSLNWNGEQ